MRLLQRAEQLMIVRVIRAGLVNMIPVLLIGAFALVFKTFPVQAYQDLVNHLAGGFFIKTFDFIYAATFGVLSIYMTVFISREYTGLTADPDIPVNGAAAASLIAFFILAGADLQDFGIDNMGPKSMFMAILTGIVATALFVAVYRSINTDRYFFMTNGSGIEFNKAVSSLIPVAIVAVVFALFDALIIRVFNVDSFHQLIILAFNSLFAGGGPTFFKGFCFVLLSSILWFFGIHGSDTLEGVMQTVFAPGLEANQAAVAAGAEPASVLTKQFFDCFVLMGGCGATICLLIAILLFSRNRGRRDLGIAAAFPMAFNINEIMVFGLPIICNPVMLIPFIATPLVCYSIAYFAISNGLVPMITGDVEWTTPILIGGYYATGSMAGCALQLFNVFAGVLIYAPFVRVLDRQTELEAISAYDSFMDYFRSNEADLAGHYLAARNDVYGDFARNLTAELRHDMADKTVLYYQPQYNYEGQCVGAEALLRWDHPLYGMLYPPLVIKLAEDGGFLPDLEETVMQHVLEDLPRVRTKLGNEVKISFNVTASTVVSSRFIQFCRECNAANSFAGKNICIEVTEQAALSFDEPTREILRELHSMGLLLAIDDFSMGHTSVSYLKNNLFDYIKLDGSLVKGLSKHDNSGEIISSITGLADNLHMTVIAEFVETEEEREALHQIGCDCYQGWLYSPAVAL